VVEKALAGKEKSWQEHEDGVITWQERIYVPKNKRLQEDIIREHHDSVAAGHPGRYKTQELVTRNYWWPYIQSDISMSTGAKLARGARRTAKNQRPH
jgi:Integrase zinc binding domain